MTTNHLYLTWRNDLRDMFTDLHQPQLRNLAYLLVGIFLSRSVHLNRIANHIPGRAKLVSVTRRLSRFLDGAALTVRPSYEGLIRPILARLAQAGSVCPVRLILDSSKVGFHHQLFHHQLLMVSVAYRRRAIPLAWTWLRCKEGHSSPVVQIALLGYVCGLLPLRSRWIVHLVGDCEFGAIDLMAQVEAWGWTYVLRQVLRQKSNHGVKSQPDAAWQPSASFVNRPGQSRWLPHAICPTPFGPRHADGQTLLSHPSGGALGQR
jgi:hypothetical protein